MKKVLPLLGLLLVLAAVIAFKWRRVGGVGERFPASRAAELAPVDAVAFFQLPDLDRTRARWPQSDLEALAQFLGWKPGAEREAVDALQKYFHPDFVLLLRMLPDFQKAAPAGLFLAAINSEEYAQPKVVGGFSYRGKRTDVESVVRAVKTHLFARWPGAKSELFSHRAIEVESITGVSPAPLALPPTAYFAYRDDWFFFATDRTLLLDALDRYLRKPGAAKCLVENPLFAEGRKYEVPEADVIVWEPWNRNGGKYLQDWRGLSDFWGTVGTASDELKIQEWKLPATFFQVDPLDPSMGSLNARDTLAFQGAPFVPGALAIYSRSNSTLTVKNTQENLNRVARIILRRQGITPLEPIEIQTDVRAAHYSGRIDGPTRLFVHTAKPPVVMAVVNRAPALAPSGALGYGAIELRGLARRETWLEHVFFPSMDWLRIGYALEYQKLSWNELWAGFGPEGYFVLLADNGRPRLTVALEVRDAANARTFAEIVGGGFSWIRAESETTQWEVLQKSDFSSEFGVVTNESAELQTGIVLTKTHLILGRYSAECIALAERLGKAGERPLPANSSGASAVSGRETAKKVSFYFDAGRMASDPTLWQSDQGLTLSLPPIAALPLPRPASKLKPGSVHLHAEASGWLLESDLSILGTYVARELLGDVL